MVGEYLAEGVRSPEVMIRRGAHKFLHAPRRPDRLFDLDADPHELENLADRLEHASLVEAFRAEVAGRWDLEELERRVLDSQRRRRIVAAALARARTRRGTSSLTPTHRFSGYAATPPSGDVRRSCDRRARSGLTATLALGEGSDPSAAPYPPDQP